MVIFVYTDGASRNNPGISASGFAVFNNDKLIYKKSIYNGVQTNNFAEYTAVISALKWCKKNIGTDVDIILYSDSELVIKQLIGKYKVKSFNIIKLNYTAKELIHEFKSIKFKNVLRSNYYISMVDNDLNILLDKISSEANRQ
ncbi:MAG: ribonuclease HI family protein [Candidatus Marsarchaeota archaeon]|jgi:ribonuclease HI|nr:ribonuclease HI family protein [Candidatus Marsarchaeota archaeon]